VTVYDIRSNNNILVNTNVKDKHSIAVTAAAGKPLEFRTSDGQLIHLKDYTYKVVQAAYGNPQLVIYADQPDIKLDRRSTLYSAVTNMSMDYGLDFNPQREAAQYLQLEHALPQTSATSNITLEGFVDHVNRLANNPEQIGLKFQLPQTSATSNVVLKGYNEELSRSGKVHSLTRQSSYGDWSSDRTTRPNYLIRGMV